MSVIHSGLINILISMRTTISHATDYGERSRREEKERMDRIVEYVPMT